MCIIHNCAPAAGAADAVCKYGNKCDRHNDTLDQIGGRNSTETAHDCVADDDKRCYDHGNRVINPEKTVKQLADGSMTLNKGLKQYKEEGVDVIVDAVNGDVKGLVNRLKAISNVSTNYKSYSGISDDMDGKVDFIFKTDSVETDD